MLPLLLGVLPSVLTGLALETHVSVQLCEDLLPLLSDVAFTVLHGRVTKLLCNIIKVDAASRCALHLSTLASLVLLPGFAFLLQIQTCILCVSSFSASVLMLY